jgi:ankyrin repeat protein
MDDLYELGERLLAHAGSGNTKTVRDLVARGANVNYPEEETGDRPLHRAAMEGHVETAQALIELGADVNAANSMGQRPLHWAAEGGHMDTIRLLIGKGAQVTAVDCESETASDWAKRHEQNEAETLLRKLEALKNRASQRER